MWPTVVVIKTLLWNSQAHGQPFAREGRGSGESFPQKKLKFAQISLVAQKNLSCPKLGELQQRPPTPPPPLPPRSPPARTPMMELPTGKWDRHLLYQGIFTTLSTCQSLNPNVSCARRKYIFLSKRVEKCTVWE